jgi:hypothetical protein
MSSESTNKIHKEPDIFQAVYPIVFQAASSNKKINPITQKVFLSVRNFTYQLFHRIIGLAVVLAQNPLIFLGLNIKAKKEFLKRKCQGKEVVFQTADHVLLNAMYFPGKNCQNSDRTVILFNGNGVCYEQHQSRTVLFNIKTWQQQEWNVLVFNYRGVGSSKGRVTRDGLILDGDTAFQYIRDKMKVPEEKILLHGHSLGAGIAGEVAALHPYTNYCNDRSFISLSKQVEEMFGKGRIGRLANRILIYFNWEFDSRVNWDKIKGKKLAIYHEKDCIIPKTASFCESLNYDEIKIKMSAGTMKIGHHDFCDDFDLLGKQIKQRKPNFITKIFMTIEKWNSAHIRQYNEQEANEYFDIVNQI